MSVFLAFWQLNLPHWYAQFDDNPQNLRLLSIIVYFHFNNVFVFIRVFCLYVKNVPNTNQCSPPLGITPTYQPQILSLIAQIGLWHNSLGRQGTLGNCSWTLESFNKISSGIGKSNGPLPTKFNKWIFCEWHLLFQSQARSYPLPPSYASGLFMNTCFNPLSGNRRNFNLKLVFFWRFMWFQFGPAHNG